MAMSPTLAAPSMKILALIVREIRLSIALVLSTNVLIKAPLMFGRIRMGQFLMGGVVEASGRDRSSRPEEVMLRVIFDEITVRCIGQQVPQLDRRVFWRCRLGRVFRSRQSIHLQQVE